MTLRHDVKLNSLCFTSPYVALDVLTLCSGKQGQLLSSDLTGTGYRACCSQWYSTVPGHVSSEHWTLDINAVLQLG